MNFVQKKDLQRGRIEVGDGYNMIIEFDINGAEPKERFRRGSMPSAMYKQALAQVYSIHAEFHAKRAA